MATSTVAQGKVILADKEGKKIPLGWAVDDNGLPTEDPAAALRGAMLPFGGPKGYGISLIIEILCSALAGAYMSPDTKSFWRDFEEPQGLGFFIGVLDIGKILSLGEFEERMDEILDRIKDSPKAQGVSEIFIPGEIEKRNAEKAKSEGIELGENVIADLVSLAKELGVSPDLLAAIEED
jgi:LDH2 family malate/lactate/ureidoglycolate dehydrogenase